MKRPKLENAKKNSKEAPGRALREMVAQKVPVEERPNVRQLQNQRPSLKSRRGLEFSVDDLASLRKFVDDPPEGVVVRERM